MKILFLAPYPIGEAPSQRFRFEQYFDTLVSQGFTYEFKSFWNDRSWEILYKKGHIVKKIFGLIMGYAGTLKCLFHLSSFDLIFIHREVTPLGPPFIEWLICKILKKQLVYDFDDAIWLQSQISIAPDPLSMLKWRQKVGAICKWSYKISCGNPYLSDFARLYHSNVVLNPTTIDTDYHKPKHLQNNPPILGWTGSHSTMPFLETLIPLLKKLRADHDFIFRVISDVAPTFELPGLQFVEWKKEQEIEVLNSIDIGIMPLPDSPWSKGKCGFKILQYMALEKATVASAVGVNIEIIDHGHNGLLCSNESDWLICLEQLLSDQELRTRLGKNGRTLVKQKYSVTSNRSNFLKLFT